MSTGAFTTKNCQCEFRMDKPFEGEYCQDLKVTKYINGQQVEVNEYRDEAGKILKLKTLYEKGQKTKEIAHDNDSIYGLSYRDYAPYNGVKYSFMNKGTTTFVNGEKHGQFANNYTNKYSITISGFYDLGLKDGPIEFRDNRSGITTICQYEKDKPIDGQVLVGKFLTTYSKGTKNGLEHTLLRYLPYGDLSDSISRHYKNGVLDGLIEYFLAGNLLASGIYQKGLPYDGVFYDNGKGTVKRIDEYDKGKPVRKEILTKDIHVVISYKKGKREHQTFYVNDQLKAEGFYENGLPNHGTFAELEILDEHYYSEKYLVKEYRGGKRTGPEKLINFKEEKVERIVDFKNNEKVSVIEMMAFMAKDSLVGHYHKSMPYFIGQRFVC